MTNGTAIDLMVTFNELDNAAQRMLTALPSQMTQAARDLEDARLRMRAALQDAIKPKIKTGDDNVDT